MLASRWRLPCASALRVRASKITLGEAATVRGPGPLICNLPESSGIRARNGRAWSRDFRWC